MKLEAERMAHADRLHRKIAALGEQFGAAWQLKSLAVPVIDLRRPIRAECQPRRGRADRVIADFHAPLLMRRDASAQLPGEHLGAEANAEKRPPLAQRHRNPIDFPAHIIIAIIGAHRPAENHRAGVTVECLRQWIAEPRTPDVQGMTKGAKRIADASRRRVFLMQDDQDRQRGLVRCYAPAAGGSPARERQQVLVTDRERQFHDSRWQRSSP